MMNILLSSLLAFSVLFAFYLFAVRRVLLDQVRFRIFSLRDDLRDLAINGKIDPTLFAYRHLEHSLCQLVNLAPALTIYQFAQFVVWRRYLPTPSREVRFKEVAPDALLNIEAKSIEALFWVLLINSPLGAILVAFFVLIAASVAKAHREWKEWLLRKRVRLEQHGREFLEREVADGETQPLPA